MRTPGPLLKSALSRGPLMVIAGALWISVIAVSFAWNWHQTGNSLRALAESEARASFEKDLLYRKWAALQGGVYVPPTEATPPNPHLAQLPDRDVTTTSGKRLTLVNPAYMTRQVHELGREQYGGRDHITSLQPIRPENAADAWETKALQSFPAGAREVVSVERLDGQLYLRLMRPLVVETSCLKCHAAQGYKKGDIRGGISISRPMAPYTAAAGEQRLRIVLGHALIGSLGLIGLCVGNIFLRRGEKALSDSELHHRSMIHSLHEDILVIDRDYRIVEINNAALKTLGKTRQQTIGRLCHEVSHGLDQPCDEHGAPCPVRQVFATGAPLSCRHMHAGRDGTTVHVDLLASPLKDAAGDVTRVIEAVRDISDLIQAQEALRKSEQRLVESNQILAGVLEHTRMLAVFLDARFNFIWVNRAYAGACRRESSFFTGQNHFDLYPYAERQALFQRVVDTGEPLFVAASPFEFPGQPEGGVTWWDWSLIPVKDDGGKVGGLVFTLAEVTERIRAEQALRKNEAGLAEAQRISHVGSWEWDLVSNTVECSEEIYRIFGLTPGTFDGKPESLLKSIHPDDRERFVTSLEDNLSRRAPLSLEYRVIHPDGAERTVCAEGLTVVDGAGTPVKNIGTVQDITERKRAGEALREASALTQILLDSMPTVALLMRPHSRRIVASNRAAAQVGAVPGATCFETWAGRDTPCPFCLATRLWASGEDQHLEVDYHGATWDAHWIPVSEDLYMHYAFDITERKQAEARLMQAQKMESIGRLAGGVAHDFNNLLTVINGYSRLLLDKLKADDPLRPNLTEIHKAGERAAGLTRQLLAFSRKQVLEPRVLDLNRVVEGMRPLLERLVGEDVEVRAELSAESGMISADLHQLEQVIMNLAVNARDAMPKGGKLLIGTAGVELDENYAWLHPEARAGRYVMLAVSDNGAGMDDQTRQHIFEPFFTTKGAGQGTGLGLSMIQGIVAQSGGYIDVHSEPGQGTTFKIYLPALAETAADAGRPAIVAALGGDETVLVVEDQPEVREYAVMVLNSYGYRVMQAESAGEALELCELEGGRIHLVLTDVVMPNLSGRELAARLEKVRPGIKVLFMSGYTGDVILDHGVLQEDAEFIQKPFSPEALAGKVRAVLGPPAPAARILVADDEPAVRAFLREVLERAGYEVLEAADGKQALRQARAVRVDLVITDLIMPEQEGIETIKALRQEMPGIGIIAISGRFDGPWLKIAASLGADAVLAKPLTAELLLAKVAEILKPRR